MQKTISIVLLASSFAFISVGAEARDRAARHTTPTATEHFNTNQSAPERVEHSSNSAMAFGLGLSTISPVVIAGGSSGSITGIIELTGLDTLQFLAAIPTTTGTFTFGVGGLYKRTLAGNANTGFHVGGGATLGTVGNFVMTIDALIGIHYTVGGTNVAFHLDGGPAFGINSLPGGTVTGFALAPYSTLLGASVAYMF